MKHAQCGAFRHAMVKVPTDWTPTFGNPVTLRCIFCDSERRLQLNNNGDIMQPYSMDLRSQRERFRWQPTSPGALERSCKLYMWIRLSDLRTPATV